MHGTELMMVLSHLIYEIRKGVRKLALITVTMEQHKTVIKRIQKAGIAYSLLQSSKQQVNIVFGSQECLTVIESFGEQNLCRLSAEQDFILGVFLGYDLHQQCQRYLYQKQKRKAA
jgi:hypothetical protein